MKKSDYRCRKILLLHPDKIKKELEFPILCARWVDALLALPDLNSKELPFLMSQLARKTDSREINLSQVTVDKILIHFASSIDLEFLKKSLLELSEMSETDQDRIFGEHLPSGLQL